MSPAESASSALQGQINGLGETMRAGFEEIKKLIGGIDERLRRLEMNEAGCQPIINQRLDAAWRKLDELEHGADDRQTRLLKLENHVSVLTKILTFIGTVVGTQVLLLIWALMTGQLHLAP